MQRDFIMNMIKKEQEKGMFENNLDINQNIDIKDINSIIEGPSI
jgi:hypothetical protein